MQNWYEKSIYHFISIQIYFLFIDVVVVFLKLGAKKLFNIYFSNNLFLNGIMLL